MDRAIGADPLPADSANWASTSLALAGARAAVPAPDTVSRGAGRFDVRYAAPRVLDVLLS